MINMINMINFFCMLQWFQFILNGVYIYGSGLVWGMVCYQGL
jgi:hypothetical protein